jgi:hypothetical protein
MSVRITTAGPESSMPRVGFEPPLSGAPHALFVRRRPKQTSTLAALRMMRVWASCLAVCWRAVGVEHARPDYGAKSPWPRGKEGVSGREGGCFSTSSGYATGGSIKQVTKTWDLWGGSAAVAAMESGRQAWCCCVVVVLVVVNEVSRQVFLDGRATLNAFIGSNCALLSQLLARVECYFKHNLEESRFGPHLLCCAILCYFGLKQFSRDSCEV